MIPGIGYEIPDDTMNLAENRIEKWQVIIQSMTVKEREDSRILNRSRIRRIGYGSGTSEKEVKVMLDQYKMMKKMMKSIRRKRMPFFGGKKSLPFKL